MSTTTKSRKATIVFEPATFNRCTDKHTGEIFYTVKGNSDTYQLVWSEKNAAWECNCPSAIKARPCKHEVALSEHLKARQEVVNEQQAAVAEVEKIITETDQEKECARCYQPITGEYIVRDGDNICTKCIAELEAAWKARYELPVVQEPVKKQANSCYNCGRLTADYRCYSCAA